MANKQFKLYAVGKKVYWIDRQRFYNDKKVHNGLTNAIKYCLDNGFDSNDIIQFDSDTECDYYELLLDRQARGEIRELKHHYLIRVQDSYVNANGDTIPEIKYNADFRYIDNQTGRTYIVDTKSSEYFLNNDGGRFILLKSVFDKLFKDIGWYIQIIIKRGAGDFYEWHIGDKQKSGKLIKKQREKIAQLKQEAKEKERAERETAKEKEMLLRYRLWSTNGHGLIKKQRIKLAELEEKFKV